MQPSQHPKLSPAAGSVAGPSMETPVSVATGDAAPASGRPTLWLFGGLVLLCTLGFAAAWMQLARDAARDLLHSYAVGIPLISAWLVHQARPRDVVPRPARGWGAGLALLALACGIGTQLAWSAKVITFSNSWLAGQMLGWVLGVWAATAWCYGLPALQRHGFALGFLIFTVPFPEPLVNAVEMFLQYSSAWTVEMVFRLTNISYLRDARSFWIPGLRFEVAQECSGIRSTLVLFITSLVGGFLLLRSPWRRFAFSALVIPLGIARNTLRICTIALLTVHVDPGIIDSPLHHRGGPLFFGVSLIPLFVLLWWFRRQEDRTPPRP